MSILPQENDFWNNLNNNNFEIPLILVGGADCLYYLVHEISEDLESFITTGKTEAKAFQVFPKKLEQLLIKQWEQLGLIITQHSQKVDYMHCGVSITYLKVRNPETRTSISFLPWFLLPDRPYPIFIYIFAIWHYHNTNEKSLSQSAAAAGKIFGVPSLNKSTVSRNIKALDNIIDISRFNRPLSVKQPVLPSDEELINLVPEILSSALSIDSLEEKYEEMIKQLPMPINSTEAVRHVLSNIPIEHSKIIKDKEVIRRVTRDIRKRPPRPRPPKSKCVQRPLEFISFWQLEQKRKDFINDCRHLVLDAAVSYHRFLF